MPTRLITPSQLSLFSISPMIGAWWEELQSQKLFDGSNPAVSELDQQLFADSLRHEQVLLTKLEKEGRSMARLPGKQTEADYAATRKAMAQGVIDLDLDDGVKVNYLKFQEVICKIPGLAVKGN